MQKTKSTRLIPCPECKATGMIPKKVTVAGDMEVTVQERCWMCGGLQYIKIPCELWKPGPITIVLGYIALALIVAMCIRTIATAF